MLDAFGVARLFIRHGRAFLKEERLVGHFCAQWDEKKDHRRVRDPSLA
jgi:hypothetical protein